MLRAAEACRSEDCQSAKEHARLIRGRTQEGRTSHPQNHIVGSNKNRKSRHAARPLTAPAGAEGLAAVREVLFGRAHGEIRQEIAQISHRLDLAQHALHAALSYQRDPIPDLPNGEAQAKLLEVQRSMAEQSATIRRMAEVVDNIWSSVDLALRRLESRLLTGQEEFQESLREEMALFKSEQRRKMRRLLAVIRRLENKHSDSIRSEL
jgi:hypothetical protein